MLNQTQDTTRLSTDEKRALAARLLRERAEAARRPPECLHRLFEQQTALHPEAVALSFKSQHITYEDLNRRANQLAHQLRALGVGPESPVGIHVDRTLNLVVAVLAVLKAGGAYVPIDPAYPAERLGYILADARVSVLLTTDDLRVKLPPTTSQVVNLDAPRDDQSSRNLDGGASPENAAYVIYTSGSTGRPKGVVVTHANVARLLSSTQPYYQFTDTDVWTLFHSFAFDFSVWELWGALAYGGRLVIVPYWISRSPDAFLGLLHDEGVTILNQTPSAFRQLIRAEEQQTQPGSLALRLVIFGGEALDPRTLRSWFERHGDIRPRLVNMYGITETTVHVTYRPITRVDCDGTNGHSPIGRAIPGWRVHVLDPDLQPVPPGVVGEIFVGGSGVARGYLDRPGLTSERFVADPFSRDPGARLYRSGDLARLRGDGSLEYVGRSDHQVKIRGFRIELGDIEAHLLANSDVREALTLARDEPTGDRRIIAYVVGRPGASLGSSSLRDWLRPRLPEYMIPSAFVVLDAFPLTANGKTDRTALPAPESVDRAEDRPHEVPRNPIESTVAAAWSEILRRERVSIHDDFFALGGHSLLATQVISRLRNALGREIPLRWLFEAPTVARLSDRISQQGGSEERLSRSINPIPRDRPLPLSFAQEALWFLDRLDPGRTTFNITGAARVQGPLDANALAHAFKALVERHESLRTTFAWTEEGPVQVVNADLGDAFDLMDLSHLAESDRLEEVRCLVEAQAREPFDLSVGPLARAQLVRLGTDDHVVLLTMHHIVTDGWSYNVAARELAALYTSFHAGVSPALPALPIQYADFAAWQRARLGGETREELLAYWTSMLRGVPTLELPTDRPRPAFRRAPGGLVPVRIPERLAETIRGIGRDEGATPFMTLLTAFQVLIHRYSEQTDFAVGSPVANRNRAELEGLVGYFINMLVLRADLSGDPTFRELLRRVRLTALGAYEHQDLPLEVLVEALQPGRDPSRTPLFQVMFVYQNHERPDLETGPLKILPIDDSASTGSAKFDLSLVLADDGPAMSGTLEYDADLWNVSTIENLIDHFLVLLESATSNPDTRIATLEMLTSEESRELIFSANETQAPRPPDAYAHRLFEASVVRVPEAPALVASEKVLTYADLNRRANRLAHVLRSRGVTSESRIALCVDRSPALAIGLLGILKAGAAYVPLDPTYPQTRLAAMLDDAQPQLILTRGPVRSHLPETSAEVMDLDDDRNFESALGVNPNVPVQPDDAAYVMYTSGSTGAPRGVVVTHRGLSNHTLSAVSLYGLSPSDRVAQFASLSFDIAVEEIFPTWAAGAAVVLRGDDETLEPTRFANWVADHGVTMLDLPTAYWHAWVDDLANRSQPLPSSLRLVVVGGERALGTVLARWRSIGGDRVRWINTYGPTETTVIATAHEPSSNAGTDDPPIGRPIANTRVYVLDRRGQLLPRGVPGELYIGGAGVARGYLNQPEATSTRFVSDPFSPENSHARLFRTGDRVRWRSDGALEFLGRLDDQIKIRGFRVEPGEVEAALRAQPGVDSAVVLATRGSSGEGRLDAYVVARDTTRESITRTLRETLPRHMVPSSIAFLDALPLTPTGKVDRSALRLLDRAASREQTTAPRDAMESQLVTIWEQILDHHPIGIHDSFFDLGGYSLLAIRLLAKIEEVLGRRLPLATLFLQPTIAELADSLRNSDTPVMPPGSPLVTLQPAGAKPAFFCVHPAGGIVYCFRDLARRLGNDRPFHALQSPGLDSDFTAVDSLPALAATYLAAIREVQPTGPYHVGGWSLGGVVAYEMARQLRESGQKVGVVAILDTTAPDGVIPPVSDAVRTLASEMAELGLLANSHDLDDDARVIAAFGGDLSRGFGSDPRRIARRLRKTHPDERLGSLLRMLRLDQVYHLESAPDRIGRLWSVLRANLRALLHYTPLPYDGRVLLFRAAEHSSGHSLDTTLGWEQLAHGGVSLQWIPGDHAGILQQPGVQNLAEALRDAMCAEDAFAQERSS